MWNIYVARGLERGHADTARVPMFSCSLHDFSSGFLDRARQARHVPHVAELRYIWPYGRAGKRYAPTATARGRGQPTVHLRLSPNFRFH
jgi:hypothetical protein